MKLSALSLLLSFLPWWPARCQSLPATVGKQVVQQFEFKGERLFFSEDAAAWGASNDFESRIVTPGHAPRIYPVGESRMVPRLSLRAARLDLAEVFWLLDEPSRRVRSTLWDQTGRGYVAQAAFPADDAVSIAFVRYGFSKGLDTPYEPILEPELLVLDTNGKRLHTLLPGFVHTEKLSLAIGGDHIAAANHERLAIWNWRSGALLYDSRLPETERWPIMALSADGKLLALSDGKASLRLLQGPAWETSVEMPVQQPLKQLCFSPDGKTLYAVDGVTGLLAWQLGKGGVPLVLHPGAFRALAVAPDGQQLLVSDAQMVYLLRR
jgi:hypothetical protein